MNEKDKHKNAFLKPNEICEFNNVCVTCNGRNHHWQNQFSCGLRRVMLIAQGYHIVWTGVKNNG